MKTGFFLGAGASFELGMPLVRDLTVELRASLTPDKLRELNQKWRSWGGGHPEEVIENLAATLRTPGMDYESILGHLQMQFRRSSRFQQNYHDLYAWLVELVYLLLYYRHIKNEAYISMGLRYFEGVIGLAREIKPLWIFSPNHDLVVECLCAQYGISVDSGFVETALLPRLDSAGKKRGDLPVKVLRGEQLERSGIAFAPAGSGALNLLKIHGAIDIFTFRDGNDLVKLEPLGPGVHGVIGALKAANEDLFYLHQGERVRILNEIPYTDENGVMQFLRRSLLAGAFKFDKRFSQVLPELLMGQFRNCINYVSKLICIGYGFGDVHINAVIRHWLESTGDRQIEIVGPAASVPPFLLHLSPQVVVTPMRATNFLERFALTPLSRRERFWRDVRAQARVLSRSRRGFA